MNNQYTNQNNDDFFYPVSSCKECPKQGTNACNTCARKRTEPRKKSECHTCNDKVQQKECSCKNTTTVPTCKTTRSVCPSDHFVVKNYFSELIHDWERDLAKYNLGIQELESINYITEEVEEGSYLNKVQFVFRRGHELITKEFLVSPKGRDGKDGKSFTWDDLTESQKKQLKGDEGKQGPKGEDGITPKLGYVFVNYAESNCDINGVFKENTPNSYDLYLTLPKQKTFRECIEEIQTILDQGINAQINTLRLRLDSLENNAFDFSKLGLAFNGNRLQITYKGQIFNNNGVSIDIPGIPQISPYTLKYNFNMDDMWKDSLALMRNNEVQGDVFNVERFKPKDWWILTYPGVIFIQNGELITKRIRISAWYTPPGELPKDMTEEYQNTGVKNFILYTQTTSTYYKDAYSNDYDQNCWTSLNGKYDYSTGMLTLPDNLSTATLSETYDGVTTEREYQYQYRSGDFISVALFSTDFRPRRAFIPIIDIANSSNSTSGNENNNSNNVYFVNISPLNLSASDDIYYAIISYTATYQFDLRGSIFYDENDNLINSKIQVNPSTYIYKRIGDKRYFLGNYTKLSEETQIITDNLQISKIELQEIFHCSSVTNDINTKIIGLYFKYNNNGNIVNLTPDQYAQFYNYWSAHANTTFNKPIVFKDNSGQEKQLTLVNYNANGDIGVIYYSYSGTDIENIHTATGGAATGRRPGVNISNLITSHKLYVKDNSGYKTYLTISRSNGHIIFTQPEQNIYEFSAYTTKFNNEVMHQISEGDIISVVDDVDEPYNPSDELVYLNGGYYYKGLLVAVNMLDGDPVISERGDYAYVISDNSVQIQNLTNKTISVEIEGMTYELTPHGKYIDEEAPIGEPIGH